MRGCDKRVLEPVPLRHVVERVVRRDHTNAAVSGEIYQPPIPSGVPAQIILLEFDIHRVHTEPVHILTQPLTRLHLLTARHQAGQMAVAPAREQRRSFCVRGQVRRVKARFAAVLPVRQREQPRYIAVASSCPGKQRQAASVCQREFTSADGLYSEAVGETGELQRSAQVGVGQCERRIAVLDGARKQLMDMGCALTERVEALAVKLCVR